MKKRIAAVLTVLFMLFMCACAHKETPLTVAAGTPAETIPESLESELKNMPVTPESQWGAYPFPLLTSMPERELYLFGLQPHGVVLYDHGHGYYFDWHYDSPRTQAPKIFVGRFSGDAEEIAVTVCSKTGTGVNIEDLYLLHAEIVNDETVYHDFYVDEEISEKLLQQAIRYRANDGRITLTSDYESKSFPIPEPLLDREIKGIRFTDIVSYQQNGDVLQAVFSVGCYGTGIAPLFFADVQADIVFGNDSFTLENVKIQDIS